MSDKTFTVFTFIGFILVLIPLPWHLHAWNAGTCMFMTWTAIGCLIHFVNSIVWSGNVELHSAVWCDIATKLIVGLSVALPCASLCINRRLYLIARISKVFSTKAEKRRAVYIDVAIGVGLPIIVMALHYIVQGHRFDIFEDIGCWPATVNMAPAYPLVWMWPILIGLVSMVYGILALIALMQRRIEFNEHLASHQNMNINRYFRLMALATMEICTTTPIAIYFLYLNLTTSPPIPWVSLADTHYNFSRIRYIPAFFINSQHQLRLNFDLNRWLFPACAFLFFIFFGMAEEARRHYGMLYRAIIKLLGITPSFRAKLGRPAKLPDVHAGADRSKPNSNWDASSIKTHKVVYPPPFSVAKQQEYLENASANSTVRVTSDLGSWRFSSYSSNSSIFTAVGPSSPTSQTHIPAPPVPTLLPPSPEGTVVHSAQVTLEPSHEDLSYTSPRYSGSQSSSSSGHENIVSPPYTSDHEDPDSLQTPQSFAQPDYDHHSQPLGGIRVTVERSVI